MGGRDPEHPLAVRADHQRRPAAGGPRPARQQLAVAGLVVAPVEVDRAVAEQAADDREGLLEPVDSMIERNPERPELRLVPAGAEAQDQPSARDLVDRVGALGEDGRVVERGAGDERPQLDPAGRGGDAREHRPGLPRTPRSPLPPAVEEVLAEPERVVAEVLERPGHVEELGPADLALDLRQLDSDLERASHRTMVAGRQDADGLISASRAGPGRFAGSPGRPRGCRPSARATRRPGMRAARRPRPGRPSPSGRS